MSVQLPAGGPREVARLGEPVAEFRAGGGRLALLVVCGVVGVLLGLAFLVGVVVLLNLGPGKGRPHPVMKAVILGLLCLSGGIETLRRARGVRGVRVYV